jgi:Na+-driven multidrug efflux pump
MLVILAGTGVLRGLQDTRTPLAVAVAANAVNIALNATFVLARGWGWPGRRRARSSRRPQAPACTSR